MAYSSQTTIEKTFGASNVSGAGGWADIDNDANATTIANRIAQAIAVADEIIDDALRRTCYLLPVQTTAAATPSLIVEISSILAGVWLYEGRGAVSVGDTGQSRHSYSHRQEWAMQMLDAIARGQVKLNAVIGI